MKKYDTKQLLTSSLPIFPHTDDKKKGDKDEPKSTEWEITTEEEQEVETFGSFNIGEEEFTYVLDPYNAFNAKIRIKQLVE